MDTASLAPARFLTQIVEEAIELARHAALTAAVAAESETSEIIRRRLFEWDENAVTADGRVLLTREAHSAAAGEPRIDVKATMSASSVTDSPVEEEGFSANLPNVQVFCGIRDPSSRSCVSQACIPGNQEKRDGSSPIGIARADTAVSFSALGEA